MSKLATPRPLGAAASNIISAIGRATEGPIAVGVNVSQFRRKEGMEKSGAKSFSRQHINVWPPRPIGMGSDRSTFKVGHGRGMPT